MAGRKYHVGQVFQTKHYGPVRITAYRAFDDVDVEFVNTGYTTNVRVDHLRLGAARDPLAPRVHGVGCGGLDMKEIRQTDFGKYAYQRWKNILERCYKGRSKYGGYEDTEVCVEWLNFSNFFPWFKENYVEGYDIDKDILSGDGPKIYSPETAVFLPRNIHNLLNGGSGASEKGLPAGVRISKDGYITAVMHVDGTLAYIGSFKTVEEAHIAYLKARADYIEDRVVQSYDKIPQRVFAILMETAGNLRGQAETLEDTHEHEH